MRLPTPNTYLRVYGVHSSYHFLDSSPAVLALSTNRFMPILLLQNHPTSSHHSSYGTSVIDQESGCSLCCSREECATLLNGTRPKEALLRNGKRMRSSRFKKKQPLLGNKKVACLKSVGGSILLQCT